MLAILYPFLLVAMFIGIGLELRSCSEELKSRAAAAEEGTMSDTKNRNPITVTREAIRLLDTMDEGSSRRALLRAFMNLDMQNKVRIETLAREVERASAGELK